MDHSLVSSRTSTRLFRSIFHEPWWLDAVAPGNWGEATVTSNGEVVARLPYINKRIMGMSGIGMAPLTHTMGPQLPLTGSSQRFRQSDHNGLMNALMDQLPRHDFFFQVCDPSME